MFITVTEKSTAFPRMIRVEDIKRIEVVAADEGKDPADTNSKVIFDNGDPPLLISNYLGDLRAKLARAGYHTL